MSRRKRTGFAICRDITISNDVIRASILLDKPVRGSYRQPRQDRRHNVLNFSTLPKVAAMPRRMVSLSAFLLLIATAWAGPARAQTFAGSYLNPQTGNLDTATAVFSLVTGSTTYLQVVLTNTSTFSNYSNPDLLSGLFFAIAGDPALTPVSAETTTLVNPTACASSAVRTCEGSHVDVGDQWGYVYSKQGFRSSGLTTAAAYGISAAGYSSLSPSFGNSAIFGRNPPDLAGNGTPQLAFSIVGSQYDADGSHISSKDPLAEDSITFDFAVPTGVTSLSISDVSFAYGTNPDGSAGARIVPEPASLTLVLGGLGVLACVRRRRRRKPRRHESVTCK
jgi:hypothetical protein